MQAHLTKVSLALLSTVFLLGCQDMGSEPVGPEGPQFDKKGTGDCATKPHNLHCHGDGGDGGGGPKPEGVLVDVIVTVGMKTDLNLPPQQMELVRNEKKGLVDLRGLAPKLTGEPYFRLEIAMTDTHAIPWDIVCETGHGDTAEKLMEEVFSNLIKPATEWEVLVTIDTSAPMNGDHKIWAFNEAGSGLVKVAPSKAVISGDINTNSFSVTFSGGQVKLGGTLEEPSPPDGVASQLFCDNQDEITFTVGGG